MRYIRNVYKAIVYRGVFTCNKQCILFGMSFVFSSFGQNVRYTKSGNGLNALHSPGNRIV